MNAKIKKWSSVALIVAVALACIEYELKIHGHMILRAIALWFMHYSMLIGVTLRTAYNKITKKEHARQIAYTVLKKQIIISQTFTAFGVFALAILVVYIIGQEPLSRATIIMYILPECAAVLIINFIEYLRLKLKNKESIESDIYLCASVSAMILALMLIVWSSMMAAGIVLLISIFIYNHVASDSDKK